MDTENAQHVSDVKLKFIIHMLSSRDTLVSVIGNVIILGLLLY